MGDQTDEDFDYQDVRDTFKAFQTAVSHAECGKLKVHLQQVQADGRTINICRASNVKISIENC